jgi:hypothetical protein
MFFDVTAGQDEWLPDEPGEVVPPDVVVTFNRHGDILDVWEQRISRPRFSTPPPLVTVPRPVAGRRQPRSRNVRGRRSKARAPSGDDSSEPEPLAPAVHCWAHELSRLGTWRTA